MKKSLYDLNWRYNDDAQFLDEETSRHTAPLFQEFVKRGFNPREIAQIMSGVINDLCLEAVLQKKATMTHAQVQRALDNGKEFWCYFHDGKQYIYDTFVPDNIDNAVLVLPEAEQIPDLRVISRP